MYLTKNDIGAIHEQNAGFNMTSNTSIVFSDIPLQHYFIFHFFSAHKFLCVFFIINKFFYFHFNCHFEWFINTTTKSNHFRSVLQWNLTSLELWIMTKLFYLLFLWFHWWMLWLFIIVEFMQKSNQILMIIHYRICKRRIILHVMTMFWHLRFHCTFQQKYQNC